jgi:hypothetical protein
VVSLPWRADSDGVEGPSRGWFWVTPPLFFLGPLSLWMTAHPVWLLLLLSARTKVGSSGSQWCWSTGRWNLLQRWSVEMMSNPSGALRASTSTTTRLHHRAASPTLRWMP